MTRSPIAVVITCRNLGATLLESLASVERQTRPAAEIVIVDDGSDDEYTRQVIALLAADGLRILRGPGRGASAARNLGARETSAPYLLWLDADDVLEPGYFDAAGSLLDADSHLDFVSCAMRAFGEAVYVWKPSPPRFVEAAATGGVPHASTMLRRAVWKEVGGFDEDVPSFELLDFWTTVIERGFRGVILDEPFINYRIRADSGYRRSIQQETYLSRLSHFYGKHRIEAEGHALELLEAKEAFFISQRNYWQSLEARAAALEAERSALDREIAETRVALKLTGVPVPSAAGAILAYHRVASLTPDSHGLCTPPDEFRRHMRYLRDNFRPMALDELVNAVAHGSVPERAVAVTLDDGYLDALTTASPILSELGIPATFFVNGEGLHSAHERWWDTLERVFLGPTAVPPVLAVRLGGADLQLATSTSVERAAALATLNRTAWPLEASARANLAREVLDWSGAERGARTTHRVLTADEVRTLAARPGHTIGAHTTHHLALSTQPVETKQREIFENKFALERLLGQPVRLFAYPYGDIDADCIRLAREAGFLAAVTIESGSVVRGTDRLLLPRCEVTPQHHGQFPLLAEQILA